MMDGIPLSLLGIVGKHRKINDPEKVELQRVDRQFLDFCDAQTHSAKHRAGGFPGIGPEKDKVPLLHTETFGKSSFFRLAEELHNR